MADRDRRDRYNLECRDPVHGFIYLSKAEWAIVDCPTFQRLRDIRQLAMAHLVYPGATHTRFEHSLGCLHLSDLIYRAIGRQVDHGKCPDFAEAFRKNDEKRERGQQLLRLASLLHDLGHTPFSHTGEGLMPEIHVDGKRQKITHEYMTARLIRETEVAETLRAEFGPESVEEVIAVATGPELAGLPKASDRAWYRFLNDILTGELGSDRMDYLLRDATHSGQSVGLFDYRKLIDSMTIVPPPEQTVEEHRLGLDGAGWLVGEQMVAARYLMYVALYFHKTKRIYEIHLEEFLKQWLKEKYGQPHFPVGQPLEYAGLTDSRVLAAIYQAAQGEDRGLKALASPFLDRSHLRLACELLLADNCQAEAPRDMTDDVRKSLESCLRRPLGLLLAPKETVSELAGDLARIVRRRHPRIWDEMRFDKLRKAVHNHVSDKLGIRCDETRHHALQFFDPKKQIPVYLNGRARYLDELSEIVSGMPDRIWRGRIYAAIESKDVVRSFCEEWLSGNPPGGGGPHVPDGS